jgi:hypothetical protein
LLSHIQEDIALEQTGTPQSQKKAKTKKNLQQSIYECFEKAFGAGENDDDEWKHKHQCQSSGHAVVSAIFAEILVLQFRF